MAIFNIKKRKFGTSEYWKFDTSDMKILELRDYDELIVKIIAKKKSKDSKLTQYGST